MAQEIADSKLLDTWSSSGTKIEPDISKIIEGWQLGEQPPHEYMNWLQNTFGSKLNHILKNGIAKWDDETEYLAGASVQHSGSIWLCETTNTNSEPTELNANWEKVAINKDLTVTVNTLADLKNISYPANTVWASGYHTKNDGAFGSHIFRLKGVKTTETDNGGTVIIATIGSVDYVYELQFDGDVNVKWFGAKGNGITDDTQAFIKASGGYVPSGNYKVTSTVNGYFFTNSTNVVIDNRYINLVNTASFDPKFKDPLSPCSSLTNQKIVININNNPSDNKLMIISKKNSDVGYIGTIIYKECSPSDANNTGGESNYRPQGVYNIPLFYSAKTEYVSKSANTTLALGAGLGASQIDSMWNYSESGNIPATVEKAIVPFSFASRNIWNLTTTNEYIIYKSDTEECDIRFGVTHGSSTSVKIQISIDGSNFIDYATVTLQQTPSGTIGFKDIKIKYNNSYYIKIINLTVGSCYIAGLDFNYSLETTTRNADCIVYMESPIDSNSIPTLYLADGGANEFAAHKLGGKWFGTYHGGHSDFEEKLKVSGITGNNKTYINYNLRSSNIPKFILTNFVELHSSSILTYDSTTYQYNTETLFADGANNTVQSIVLISGVPIVCDTIYTHMATTQRNFNFIRQPIYLSKNDDGDVTLGNVSFISQYNTDGRSINCYFSTTDCSRNIFGGARISFSTQYNKQYYGGTVSSTIGEQLLNCSFRTIKEFL